MLHQNIEIMAPVGSWESLMAAVKAGCNSVYFGIEQLNMRARSSINFTVEDLSRIAEVCNNNIRTYITLNTVLYDHDLNLMRNIIDSAKINGIDAVIVSDHAAMNYAKKIGYPVHISTQANISNIETVEFYANFADVIVLARELSLQQVSSISSEIKRRGVRGPSGELVEIEIFAHGALCMAVSGKCYLSLHSHNASANRGACIQNCRREYTVIDKEEGVELDIDNEYIMSAKDLATIDFLDMVLGAGVKVLKIEGRGRSADYVYTTVKCYREAVDAVLRQDYTYEKIEDWKKRLSTVYNRGFWDGYYLGRRMGEWSSAYGSTATTKKIFLGKGIKYFSRIKVGEFLIETHSLKRGDRVLITGPTTGVIETSIEELRVDDKIVDEAKRGEHISIRVDEPIRASDKIYKIVRS